MNEEEMTSLVETAPSTAPDTAKPLYRGIGIVALAAVPIGAAFSIVDLRNQTLAPVIMVIGTTAGLGMIQGLIARYALPRRGWQVRWLVAIFGLCVSMIFLGWLSRGTLGMNLIGRASPEPDWSGLLQLLGSSATAWVAVSAWTGRPAIRLGRSRRAKSGGARLRSTKRTRLGFRPRRKVRLTNQVEHRCPFCLELVESGDPRGSVECSICHSLHHADCWAVTGTCQVPHHNS